MFFFRNRAGKYLQIYIVNLLNFEMDVILSYKVKQKMEDLSHLRTGLKFSTRVINL